MLPVHIFCEKTFCNRRTIESAANLVCIIEHLFYWHVAFVATMGAFSLGNVIGWANDASNFIKGM